MHTGPLSKIFTIIETIVANQNTGMTYAEIVGTTGLPKSSVHRALKELTQMGYLYFSPDTKKYRGSMRLAAIGADVMANFDLREHTHPYLLELHRETEHTSNTGIRDGRVGVFIDKIESKDYGIKLFSEVGKTFPLHCTSLGKVLLAWGSPDITEALLEGPLEPATENTITDPQKLIEELKAVRHKGYAVDYEEITRGIMCVAAPVCGVNGDVVCAISITFPSYIYHDRGMEPEIEAVTRYAAELSGEFKQQSEAPSIPSSAHDERVGV